MRADLDDIEFVIFDVETTGLFPQSGDKILEIAAVRLKKGIEIAEFSSLVNPARPIAPAAFAINQISEDMVRYAPQSSQVLPKFLEFIKGAYLAAYNASFDLGFVVNEIKPLGLELSQDIPVIDILIMARSLLPSLGRYPLWYVAESLGVQTGQLHRALLDVKLTTDVFNRLMNIARRKNVKDTLDLLSLFGIKAKALESFNQEKIFAIQKAIDLKTRLKIRYFSSARAHVCEREVTLKFLKEERSKNVLVGFCHLRNEERSFRVDRILHMEIL
jgi:DNA polymerase III epsilon subunit family exonuclease